MSSMFDSQVYALRNRIPFVSPQFLKFIQEKAMESNYSVILECIYRPKVATALWYSLSWVDDNDRTYKVEAQDFTLLMWRAIQKHREQTILQDMDFLPQFNHQDGSGI